MQWAVIADHQDVRQEHVGTEAVSEATLASCSVCLLWLSSSPARLCTCGKWPPGGVLWPYRWCWIAPSPPPPSSPQTTGHSVRHTTHLCVLYARPCHVSSSVCSCSLGLQGPRLQVPGLCPSGLHTLAAYPSLPRRHAPHLTSPRFSPSSILVFCDLTQKRRLSDGVVYSHHRRGGCINLPLSGEAYSSP